MLLTTPPLIQKRVSSDISHAETETPNPILDPPPGGILAVGDAHVWLPDSAAVCGSATKYPTSCSCRPAARYCTLCASCATFLASSTTLTRARVKLPCQIVGTLWLSTTTALPSSCPLLSARPPNRLHPWSSRLVGPQPPRGRPAALLTSVGSVFPADTVSTPQSLLYQRLGNQHGLVSRSQLRRARAYPI